MHARARVGIKDDAEARSQRVRVARAEEARVVEADDENDAVSHDPLVNGAHRHLFELLAQAPGGESGVRVLRVRRALRAYGQARAAERGAQAVARAGAQSRGRLHALERAGLPGED